MQSVIALKMSSNTSSLHSWCESLTTSGPGRSAKGKPFRLTTTLLPAHPEALEGTSGATTVRLTFEYILPPTSMCHSERPARTYAGLHIFAKESGVTGRGESGRPVFQARSDIRNM